MSRPNRRIRGRARGLVSVAFLLASTSAAWAHGGQMTPPPPPPPTPDWMKPDPYAPPPPPSMPRAAEAAADRPTDVHAADDEAGPDASRADDAGLRSRGPAPGRPHVAAGTADDAAPARAPGAADHADRSRGTETHGPRHRRARCVQAVGERPTRPDRRGPRTATVGVDWRCGGQNADRFRGVRRRDRDRRRGSARHMLAQARRLEVVPFLRRAGGAHGDDADVLASAFIALGKTTDEPVDADRLLAVLVDPLAPTLAREGAAIGLGCLRRDAEADRFDAASSIASAARSSTRSRRRHPGARPLLRRVLPQDARRPARDAGRRVRARPARDGAGAVVAAPRAPLRPRGDGRAALRARPAARGRRPVGGTRGPARAGRDGPARGPRSRRRRAGARGRGVREARGPRGRRLPARHREGLAPPRRRAPVGGALARAPRAAPRRDPPQRRRRGVARARATRRPRDRRLRPPLDRPARRGQPRGLGG
jgi:hypothetical protein